MSFFDDFIDTDDESMAESRVSRGELMAVQGDKPEATANHPFPVVTWPKADETRRAEPLNNEEQLLGSSDAIESTENKAAPPITEIEDQKPGASAAPTSNAPSDEVSSLDPTLTN